jgi:hypothetical protein
MSAFLIDARFLLRNTTETFWGASLIVVDGKDNTFCFGFLRDLLRLRNSLRISAGVIVFGSDASSLATEKDARSVVDLCRELGITTNPMKTDEHCQEGEEIARPTDKNRGAERATTDDQPTMNTTSWPTQASVASWASLEGESRSFWATARTWLLELFTSALTRDVEPRCLPSVAFTPSGPLVYQWQIHRSTAQDGVASSWLRNTATQSCSSASFRAISCRRLSSGKAAPGQPIHLVSYCPSGSPSSAATSPPEDLMTRSSSTVTGKRLETLMRVLGMRVLD